MQMKQNAALNPSYTIHQHPGISMHFLFPSLGFFPYEMGIIIVLTSLRTLRERNEVTHLSI